MKENEFDLDFDFEKEYGFDLPKEDDKKKVDDDFDLKAILESDFTEEAELFNAEYTNDFDYGPQQSSLADTDGPAGSASEEENETDFFQLPSFEQRSVEDLMEEDDLPILENPSDDAAPAADVDIPLDETPEEYPHRLQRNAGIR